MAAPTSTAARHRGAARARLIRYNDRRAPPRQPTPSEATVTPSPGQLGWHMPAEWHPHLATWLAWPHHRPDWPGKFGPIPWVYADLVRHLHTREFVHLLVPTGAAVPRARAVLRRAGVDLKQVRFFVVPTDRAWVR